MHCHALMSALTCLQICANITMCTDEAVCAGAPTPVQQPSAALVGQQQQSAQQQQQQQQEAPESSKAPEAGRAAATAAATAGTSSTSAGQAQGTPAPQSPPPQPSSSDPAGTFQMPARTRFLGNSCMSTAITYTVSCIPLLPHPKLCHALLSSPSAITCTILLHRWFPRRVGSW